MYGIVSQRLATDNFSMSLQNENGYYLFQTAKHLRREFAMTSKEDFAHWLQDILAANDADRSTILDFLKDVNGDNQRCKSLHLRNILNDPRIADLQCPDYESIGDALDTHQLAYQECIGKQFSELLMELSENCADRIMTYANQKVTLTKWVPGHKPMFLELTENQSAEYVERLLNHARETLSCLAGPE